METRSQMRGRGLHGRRVGKIEDMGARMEERMMTALMDRLKEKGERIAGEKRSRR